jgi:carboxyl-terminal processing protease
MANRLGSLGGRRGWWSEALLGALAGALLVAAPTASGQDRAGDMVATSGATIEPLPLPGWSEAVWQAAQRGESDRLEAFLRAVPSDAVGDAAERLRSRVAQRRRLASEGDATRREEQAESMRTLATHLEAGEITRALTAAVRAQTLSEEWGAVLDDPLIKALIGLAEAAAEEAQAQGDWLLAQELLFRLRTLHEDVGRGDCFRRHQQAMERVNRRISLLAQYAPRGLHELRRRQAQRMAPDQEFPAFNPEFAEDWREQVRGISQPMLAAALRTVVDRHIANMGWRPLIEGGLDAMDLVATTPALVENFPALANPVAVAEWQEAVESCRRLLAAVPDRELSRRQYARIVGELQLANRRTIDLPEPVLFREFGDGAMYAVTSQHEDQYTEIIWPERYRRFQQQVEGRFVGVGILIRHNDRREIEVVNPLEGSPAWRGGVRPGDVIVEVDGVSTVGWSTNRAVDEITGPAGRSVELTVERGEENERVRIPLVREQIKMRSVNGWWKRDLDESGEPLWDWWLDPSAGVGYVRLTSFNEESFRDFRSAIAAMQAEGPLRGLVLDLRHNPGGLLKSAVDFANLYLQGGVVVTGENRFGEEDMRIEARRNRAELVDLPTVVLINQGSASASEIVAGALQAYGAAVVLGDRSFGKGSVQEVHDVSDRNAPAILKLTTQHYRLPPATGEARGRLVHKRPGADDWGVNPDIVVRMTPSQIEQVLNLRQRADQVLDPASVAMLPEGQQERPDVARLLDEGLDPQLETALLILQARALRDLERDPALAAGKR